MDIDQDMSIETAAGLANESLKIFKFCSLKIHGRFSFGKAICCSSCDFEEVSFKFN